MDRIYCAVAMCAFALVVRGDTWYFTGDESSTDTGAFTDATKWLDANSTAATAFSAADSYVLTNFGPGETSATEHTLRAHGGVFANGARLDLNANSPSIQSDRKRQHLYIDGDSTPESPTEFTRGLLFGHNALICPMVAGTTNVINGDIELIAPNGGQIPRIQPLGKGITLILNGKMTGSTSLGMYVQAGSGSTVRDFTVKFRDDVSWGGQLYLPQPSAMDSSCKYNVRLAFGSITFSPSFRCTSSGIIYAVDSVDDTVTLKVGLDAASWPLRADTCLEFPVDATTGKAGKMVLNTRLYGLTNECINVILSGNVFDGTATNRFELMSTPIDYPLDAGVFRLKDDYGLTGNVVKFEVVNDETYSTLYAIVPPMVKYMKSDAAGQAYNLGSHIESAEGWSNGAVPQPGYDYMVVPTNSTEKVLRTPDSNLSASYTFPGDSLTIASNASLRCYVGNLRVDDLRLLNGAKLYSPNATAIGGSIDIVGTARIGTYASKYMTLTNRFTGSGTIDFAGMWIASDALAHYRVYGDNSGFTGKMIVRTAYRDSKSVPSLTTDYGLLHFASANALGGNLDTLTYDAITITDYAYLWLENADVTIAAESNRGITIKDVGRLWTSSTRELRVETPLTIDGTCYKDGMGTLTLAGEAIAATGGGADSLIVTNGTLCVAGAQAINGLAVRFCVGAAPTKFLLKPNLSDAEFTAKGADVSDLDTPFTLDDSFGGKLPLVEFAKADRVELPSSCVEYGVLTVKATSADAIRAMLPDSPPKYYANASAKWVETADAEAGTVTFGVRCTSNGLSISIR